jgi:long-subunit fatty acid transport protein
MRKFLTFFAGTLITGSVLAGGLVTNNNQSAMFTRLLNRNASTDIDAVYFNPAGLTKLGNGFFVSINNQTIGQTQTVGNNYLYLSGTLPREYVGKVSAPIYPGVYLVYNTGKLSFSAGVNPVGGGGGAEYKTGIPSIESQIADLVPGLVANEIPTTEYSADIYFKGSSIYMGYQANIAYKISDMFSVAAGARLVSSKNTAQGHMTNIKINPTYPTFGASFTGGMVLAKDFFTAGATFFNALPAQATGAAAQVQPIIDAGFGSTLLANGASVGMSAAGIQGIQGLLKAKGLTVAQIGAVTIASAQTQLQTAGPVYLAKSAAMADKAARTSDIYLDAEQTGMAVTPILSVNFSPNEKLNIALKYEFKTKLNLKTNVFNNKTGGGLYIQDSVSIADLPAFITGGINFKPIDKLMLSGSFGYYFDKKVDYDGQTDVNINQIDKNFFEFGIGAEYSITDKLRISAGWAATHTGVNSAYQSDLSYSTNTNSFGGGFGYRITPMIDLNIGGQYAIYQQGSKSFNHYLDETNFVPVIETYDKSTWIAAIGLNFYFGK